MKRCRSFKRVCCVTISFAVSVVCVIMSMDIKAMASKGLLTDPYMALPTYDSVFVEWYTESEGKDNKVLIYENGTDKDPTREIGATTYKLSRLRGGKKESDCDDPKISASVYKHRAIVRDLPAYHGKESERIPYRVISDGAISNIYTLAAKPAKGADIRILLTSDLQIKDMCSAGFEAVEKKIGRVDALFINGDLADVPDRAYDWFYSDNAFFRSLQGRASHVTNGKEYKGGKIIQYAPIYSSIGNHDVMGVYNDSDILPWQFNNAKPRQYAIKLLEAMDTDKMSDEQKAGFIEDNSYNTITYEELFDLPISPEGGEKYYAVTIGDIRLIVLDLSRIWRQPMLGIAGKYSEYPGATQDMYGFGDFIFEDIGPDSKQMRFLKRELASDEYKKAKYKIVMFHFQYHSLGGNQIPPFTDPVPDMVKDPVTGLDMVTYDYPIDNDYIDRYVAPLLEDSGVDLVYTAHSHIWNRFMTASGMNILESSNIGNTYNCFYKDAVRSDYPSALNADDPRHSIAGQWNEDNYVLSNDPYGLEPIYPNKAKLSDGTPYLASNSITAFSILDTGKGTVDSYYYDTSDPDSDIVLFDSFNIDQRNDP